MFKNPLTKDQRITALIVFLFLLTIYLLSYSGVPISDDEHLFAAVSQNLVVSGEFRADQLSGNQRLQGRYNDIGPLHPLIGSLAVWLVWPFETLGAMQVLYFLSPIYTALTAALIFVYALQKGYKKNTGILAALSFGLTTIAWPYAQTFYREPLAMLLLMATYLIYDALTDDRISSRYRWAAWLLGGIFLFGAILTKIYTVLVVPLFLLPILKRYGRSRKFWLTALTVPIFVYLAGWVLDAQSFSRLDTNFTHYLLSIFGEKWETFISLSTPKELTAILFSPSKGFLIYSPILILGTIGMISPNKFLKVEWSIPTGTFALFLLAQLFIYHNAWWNISWSTRFLLPTVPLLVLTALPILDSILQKNSIWPKVTFFFLSGVGFVIQTGGILISPSAYLARVCSQQHISDLSETIWRADLAPALYHWKMLSGGETANLAWVHNFSLTPIFVGALLTILLAVFIYLCYALMRTSNVKPISGFFNNRNFNITLTVYLVFIVPVFLLIAYRLDPFYFSTSPKFQEATQYLNQEIHQNETLVIDSYQQPAWYYFINFGRLHTIWYSFPEQEASWKETLDNIHETKGQRNAIWLLVREEQMQSVIFMLKSIYGKDNSCNVEKQIVTVSQARYQMLHCINSGQ